MKGSEPDKSQPADQVHDGHEQKGKAKEAPTCNSSAQNDQANVGGSVEKVQPTDASILSRFTTSTLALGSSLLTTPDIGALGSPTIKAGPASNTGLGTALGETSNSKRQTSASSGDSIRSAQVQGHIQREEAAFAQFLDGVDSSAVSENVPENVPNRLVCDSLNREGTVFQSQSDASHRLADSDGLEVVKLLDAGYDEVMLMDPVIPLSKPQELRLKQALFGEGSNADEAGKQASDWSNILNFVPEYISNGSSGWGYNELSGHLGTSDTLEASEIWADQWGDVLSRYTDEVWGDLGSLVQEAREEARKIQKHEGDSGPSETKALMRLRQILSHIRDNR
ncbi:hypothetical protein PFICI_00620 [Pestalotiopsis fici W106-1]|uniref:Uncharacterized protein n=1 Tax=Pestalotiopsis fici (strain W106-1 / CGMCC3.15140) TaxID=1229662 RepID=W3XMQ9_PESFW|nr:uncharacterized protein PFICI_00620 [Pestalotiopsis fici W106-1]ETS86792.1 hypothetical protein PFICI_00620 [Pestalotiopsis fici W106-1]